MRPPLSISRPLAYLVRPPAAHEIVEWFETHCRRPCVHLLCVPRIRASSGLPVAAALLPLLLGMVDREPRAQGVDSLGLNEWTTIVSDFKLADSHSKQCKAADLDRLFIQ